MGMKRTFPQDRIRVPTGRVCQVVLQENVNLSRLKMILECECSLTGMPPFVVGLVAMEEGRYTVSEDYTLMMIN